MSYLQQERKKLGLTQGEIELKTGIDSSTLSLYENNLRVPSVENAKKLGEAMGFNWVRLFEKESTDD